MIVSLNPDYYLKWDIKRIILFSKKQCRYESNVEWISLIHPLHAIIIGTLCIEHELDKAITLIEKTIPVNKAFIETFIHNLVENEQPCHVQSGKNNITFPKKLFLLGNFPHSQKNIPDIIQKSLSMNEIDLQTSRLLYQPMSITWMLNNKCAVRCIYCYADIFHKNEEIPFERFQEIICKCKDDNLQGCEIIGGDLFCKKDWHKFLTCLINNDLEPSFISTKKVISINEIELLVNTGYRNVLQISLDSLVQHELEAMIHCPSFYAQKIKEMLHYLSQQKELPFKVRISTVLTQINANIQTIQEMFSFLSELKLIEEWEIRFAMPSFTQSKEFICSSEQIKLISDYIFEISRTNCLSINFIEYNYNRTHLQCDLAESREHNNRCTANLHHCFILPDGKVTLCERLYWNPNFIIGDINTMSLSDIWTSSRAKQLAFDMEKHISKESSCFLCEGKNRCYSKNKRCWVEVINKWGKDNITHPDPVCTKSN